jgi:hypothetical protein
MTGAERGEPARINPLVLNYYVWLMGLLQGLPTRRYELCYQGPLTAGSKLRTFQPPLLQVV